MAALGVAMKASEKAEEIFLIPENPDNLAPYLEERLNLEKQENLSDGDKWQRRLPALVKIS